MRIRFFKFELGMSIIFFPEKCYPALVSSYRRTRRDHRSTGYVPNLPAIHSGESGPNRGTPTSYGTKCHFFPSKAPGDTL